MTHRHFFCFFDGTQPKGCRPHLADWKFFQEQVARVFRFQAAEIKIHVLKDPSCFDVELMTHAEGEQLERLESYCEGYIAALESVHQRLSRAGIDAT